jgi:hypothetical protein
VCSVGLERLAYLLIAYGLGASAASILGLLGLWLPRSVPLVAGAGLHLLLTLSLFFWAPAPRVLQHSWILYVAAALWGVGSALNKTGLSSEYSHEHWGAWEGPVAYSGWLGHWHLRDKNGIPWAPGDLSWGSWVWYRKVGMSIDSPGVKGSLMGSVGTDGFPTWEEYMRIPCCGHFPYVHRAGVGSYGH